jgi:hypothetical protein
MKKLRLSKREIATATLVIHELLFGFFRLPLSKKRQDLEDYINNVILANLPLYWVEKLMLFTTPLPLRCKMPTPVSFSPLPD